MASVRSEATVGVAISYRWTFHAIKLDGRQFQPDPLETAKRLEPVGGVDYALGTVALTVLERVYGLLTMVQKADDPACTRLTPHSRLTTMSEDAPDVVFLSSVCVALAVILTY